MTKDDTIPVPENNHRGDQLIPEQVLVKGLPQFYTDLTPNSWAFRHPNYPPSRLLPYLGGAGMTFRSGDGTDTLFRLSVFRDVPTSQGAAAKSIGRYRFEAPNSNDNGTPFVSLQATGTDFTAGNETANLGVYTFINGSEQEVVRFRSRYNYLELFDYGFRLNKGGTQTVKQDPSGQYLAGAGPGFTPESLAGRTPRYAGEIAVDDGTNTTSGNAELAVGQAANGSWYTMGGDLI